MYPCQYKTSLFPKAEIPGCFPVWARSQSLSALRLWGELVQARSAVPAGGCTSVTGWRVAGVHIRECVMCDRGAEDVKSPICPVGFPFLRGGRRTPAHSALRSSRKEELRSREKERERPGPISSPPGSLERDSCVKRLRCCNGRSGLGGGCWTHS